MTSVIVFYFSNSCLPANGVMVTLADETYRLVRLVCFVAAQRFLCAIIQFLVDAQIFTRATHFFHHAIICVVIMIK